MGGKKMVCSSCGNEMVKGNLFGDRYALKWQAEDKKLVAGIWSTGGIKLKTNSAFGRLRSEAYVCQQCKKLVIDLETQAV